MMQFPIKSKAYAVSYIGIFTSVLAVLSFFESKAGINFGVPGVKLGISNAVIIIALSLFGGKASLALAIMKILFSLIYTSGMSGFLFTACGTLSGVAVMYISKKLLKDRVSLIGISVLGGTTHITAQYLCSSLLLGTLSVWGLYPYAAFMSLLTSAGVGFICNLIVERMNKK